jgi:hypothetical protein
MDPKRLIEGDDLGAIVLGSGRHDDPGPAARERVAAALGLAVGTAALTSGSAAGAAGAGASASIAPKAIGAAAAGTGASAGGAAGIGAGAGAGAMAAKATGSALLVKLLAGGVLTAAIAGGVVVAKHPRAAAPVPSTPVTAAATNPGGAPMNTGANRSPVVLPPATIDPASPGPESTPEVSSGVPVSTPVKPVAANASTRSGKVDVPTETPLAKELRSLDAARTALNRGDASGCLAELDRHDRTFPTGALRMESGVLRAEALLARGDTARAKRLAQDLLARDPSGPSARRLRTILDGP